MLPMFIISTIVQIIFNFLFFSRLKKMIIEKFANIDDYLYETQLKKVENNLNSRLREIQTSQFSPQIRRPSYINLVTKQNKDS